VSAEPPPVRPTPAVLEPSSAAAAARPRGGLEDELAREARLPRWVGYLGMPLFLALSSLALYLYVSGLELDSIEQRTLNREFITEKLIEHLKLTGASTAIVIAIAVPLGILLTRPAARRISGPAVIFTGLGQALPSIGLLVLFAVTLGLGFKYAVYALVAYSVLPILQNTMVGLRGVDRSLIEAARGMGMTKLGVLWRIELPLAVPVILAGVRTALVLNVGTATLATFVNAGGLGFLIANALALDRQPVLITGSALTAILALFIDWMAGVAEDLLRPKGL
jgi:osmoprotectant transport system permease protein